MTIKSKAIVDSLIQELKASGSVRLSGFGSFKVKTLAARKGRNPKTGEEITIPERKKIAFKAFGDLKEAFKSN